MTFRDPVEAFDAAIREGKLSAQRGWLPYAGDYMYMGTDVDGIDLFKHIDSRQYLGIDPTE
jgi:hypothetical protein